MNDKKTVQTAMWVMIGLQTIGSVDMPKQPGSSSPGGPRKMPAPRAYVAIFVLFGILGVWADTTYSRGAARLAWLVVLTGMVVGPFGTRAVNFMNSIASQFGVTQTSAIPQPTKTSPAQHSVNASAHNPVRPRKNISI